MILIDKMFYRWCKPIWSSLLQEKIPAGIRWQNKIVASPPLSVKRSAHAFAFGMILRHMHIIRLLRAKSTNGLHWNNHKYDDWPLIWHNVYRDVLPNTLYIIVIIERVENKASTPICRWKRILIIIFTTKKETKKNTKKHFFFFYTNSGATDESVQSSKTRYKYMHNPWTFIYDRRRRGKGTLQTLLFHQ